MEKIAINNQIQNVMDIADAIEKKLNLIGEIILDTRMYWEGESADYFCSCFEDQRADIFEAINKVREYL